MYIREIHIKNFRHLENVHLGPFSEPPSQSDLVVLAGPNGGGKSSVLELLGYALSNAWSLNWNLRRSFPDYSFEVAIGLTDEERELILVPEYAQMNGISNFEVVTEYLKSNSVYYRSYNYNEGEYQKNAVMYNYVHNLVTSILRSNYGRSLGFFLRSDRSYPITGFQRERLFAYDEITNRDYIWNMAFNLSEIQYRDMFEFLVQQRYHYFSRLGHYTHQKNLGDITDEEPTDPLLPYDALLQQLFPGYSFAQETESIPTNLFVKIPSGEVIPFTDLSSGEKEVFFILSFFIRHSVTHSIIVVDEPEMHLHPELARLLVRTMQSTKIGNQLWLATHNPEIIDEAGREKVVYLTRDPVTRKAIVTLGTDESSAIRSLKDMFGYSGYLGIAKSLVFLEGTAASSDRKMFSNLFPEQGSRIKFVPSNSSGNLQAINAAILSILESNLGSMQFYLIRDRDYLTQEMAQKYVEHTSGHVHVLERHEIENYLLDVELISKTQTELFNKPTNAAHVLRKLREIACDMSGEVLRDMLSFRLNIIFGPQDFSLGKLLRGEKMMDSAGVWDAEKVNVLQTNLLEKVEVVIADLNSTVTEAKLDALLTQYKAEISNSVSVVTDQWMTLFPGKQLLEMYSKKEGLGAPIVLQNSLIKELSSMPNRIPLELKQLVNCISQGEQFPHD